MSRRHRAEKREVIEDAKFGDLILAKFMNSIMYDGKKSVAEAIVYGPSTLSRPRQERSARRLQDGARECRAGHRSAVSPRRGATYQVPVEVRNERRQRWRSVGSSTPRATATTRPWWTGCRPNCSTPPTTAAPP